MNNNLPTIPISKDIDIYKKLKLTKEFYRSQSQINKSNVLTPNNINTIKNTKIDELTTTNSYDYFNTTIPKKKVEKYIQSIRDEKFLFFLKYGILRRYEGDCEIIYIEIPQIQKKLIVYRLPHYRLKFLESFNLNNKDLPSIPLFESEDKLKYLSMESNHINKIEHLISLNSLIYLNLYGNNIKEIENLNNVKKLVTLLLGRNNITQIKNLNQLTNLEILDLHSNKIKCIEGLQNLKKLREINLSNNLLCSFHELSCNKNLEDINLRKNLISAVPTINQGMFDSLKRINLSKNLINKIHFLEEFSKINTLKEIYLDYNPVLNNPEMILFLNKLPLKGQFPLVLNNSTINATPTGHVFLKKNGNSNLDANDSNSILSDNLRYAQKNNKKSNKIYFRASKLKRFSFSTSNFKKQLEIQRNDEEKNNKIKTSLMSTIRVRNFSPDFSKTKIILNGKLNLKLNFHLDNLKKSQYKTLLSKKLENDNMRNKGHYLSMNLGTKIKDINDDKSIRINIKILSITKQWSKEYQNIKQNGYNGYNNKKQKETNINQGYVEIDGDNNNCLTVYGNGLKIFENKNLYNSINVIKFNYFSFDLITCKKFFGYIKMFKDIKKFYFNFNNIFSVYQLIKLESFKNLENIHITNNEICCSEKFVKLFIIYRMNQIKIYNNEIVKFDEKILSNKIFCTFDNYIVIKENENKKNIENQSKDTNIKENILTDIKNNLDNNLIKDNEENKFLMWNFVKQNISNALYNIIFEGEDIY